MFSSSSLSFVHSTEEIGILPLPLVMVVDVGDVGGASCSGGGESTASLADARVAIQSPLTPFDFGSKSDPVCGLFEN